MTPGRTEHRASLARLAHRAVRMEVGVWTSLVRWTFRRPRVPTGAVAFTYHKPISMVLGVFVALSAVEIVIIDLVVHRWTWVRIPLLVLGIWGFTWMLGYLCGYVTRPHAVGPGGVCVRNGAETAIELPWSAIDSVAVKRIRRPSSRSIELTEEDGTVTVHLPIQGETNIEIVLDAPATALLPQGRTRIDRIEAFADDPQDLLAAVRRFMRAHEAAEA